MQKHCPLFVKPIIGKRLASLTELQKFNYPTKAKLRESAAQHTWKSLHGCDWKNEAGLQLQRQELQQEKYLKGIDVNTNI